MFVMSVLYIAQGYDYPHDADAVSLTPLFMRPSQANNFGKPAARMRIWDNIAPRLFAPVTTLWLFALSTGQGFTTRFFKLNFVTTVLAPASFGCFLFHQMIGQWYYAATRGLWWNWWNYRKDYYWFSPHPCPVEWYEWFYVIGLVVIFSNLIMKCEPKAINALSSFKKWILCRTNAGTIGDQADTITTVSKVIQKLTGIEVEPEWTLEECGLASLGVTMLVGLLNKEFSSPGSKIRISVADMVSASTIQDIADVVDKTIQASNNATGLLEA
jgi:hypothetical protein